MEHIDNVIEDIKALVPMGGVTVPDNKIDLNGLYKRRDFVVERARTAGLEVIEMKESAENPCPFLILTFPEMVQDGKMLAKIALVGHMDVVDVQKPDQFTARVEGDFIHGRGTTDMLGVDSVFLEWMRAQQLAGGKKPPFMVMLSFTEENDSALGHNTYTAREFLEKQYGADIEFAIIGERTGEMTNPDELVTSTIRDSNYGLRRYEISKDLSNRNNEQSISVLMNVNHLMSGFRQRLAAANSKDGVGTTFAAPFIDYRARLDPGASSHGFLRLSTNDLNTTHSAQSKPSQFTPIEEALKRVDLLGEQLNDFQLLRFSVGQGVNNYNTISSSSVIEIAHRNNDGYGQKIAESVLAGAGKVEVINFGDIERGTMLRAGIEMREAPIHAALVTDSVKRMRNGVARFRGKVDISTERSGWVCDQSNHHLGKLRNSFEYVTGEQAKSAVKVFFNDGSAFIHSCDGHTHTGQPIARAVVFGGVGFGPHGPAEKAHIPGFETQWRELDAFAAQY